MTYQKPDSEFQNSKTRPCLKEFDHRLPGFASNLIRLVVVELPGDGIAPNDIISDIRASYPNAEIMFTAPQAAMAVGARGLGMAAASPCVSDQALMYGLNAMARATSSPMAAPGPLHETQDLPLAEGSRRFPPRQAQVATGLVRGLSNKGIARELDLSESTVKVYVVAIFKALDVHSRAGAISTILSSPALRQELGL